MKEYVTSGVVQGGVLKIRNRKQLDAAFAGWRDCEVRITIERAHATRSSQANRYYWGVVVDLLAEHTGYTPEETHDVLKQLFLPKRCAMLTGNGDVVGEFVIGGSTAKLTTIEFYEYCSRIREWALHTLAVDIPAPTGSAEAAA
jgi:hypothetical protein